ncbi:MAG: DUF559 domain-containing protein [Candidatus Doudnabacteria bacterium]|nr:DUF559 domain-containing protein [Candidatus Doudnabacteria bacterium]
MVKLSRVMIAHSKDLRTRQTIWESLLWEHLRANNSGIKFKRQIVLGQYIFDFGAKRKKLLIELDGFGHKGTGKVEDKKKIDYATKAGYKVLKFWNSEIEKKLPDVLDKIFRAIK